MKMEEITTIVNSYNEIAEEIVRRFELYRQHIVGDQYVAPPKPFAISIIDSCVYIVYDDKPFGCIKELVPTQILDVSDEDIIKLAEEEKQKIEQQRKLEEERLAKIQELYAPKPTTYKEWYKKYCET